MRLIKSISLAAVIATGTLLGGCATKESVEHAQASADLADSNAKDARGAADRAQTTADGAAKTAGDAMGLAQNANDKIDKYIADQERKKHMAILHRKHRRHVASADTNNCPAPMQKSELKKTNKAAQNVPVPQPSKSPTKTASN